MRDVAKVLHVCKPMSGCAGEHTGVCNGMMWPFPSLGLRLAVLNHEAICLTQVLSNFLSLSWNSISDS